MYDKTWILLIVLTISWSTWHNDDKDHLHNRDETTGDHERIVENEGDKSKVHAHVVGF